MAESRTFIFIFLGPLGFYVHRCISPHVSFEFNLRKGQKSDKLSEAISERDGNSFIFLGSSFFFWIIYLSETHVNKNNVTFIISWNAARVAFNPEVILRLSVRQTPVPYFKTRRAFIQTSTDWRRACCWSEKKRNRGEIPGDGSSQRPNVWQKQRSASCPLSPKTITNAWNSPAVAVLWVRRSRWCVGPPVRSITTGGPEVHV